MATTAGTADDIVLDPKRDRLVILASSLGTIFEWYDFFLYGILASLLGRLFFATGNPTTELLFSLGAFAVGFFFRPIGALIFGHFGDKIGRKYTFLVTISLMGGATAAIGLLPTYASAGLLAPVLLLLLRMLQGMALGGEYGGAAIYVAEHAPAGRRGFYTSFIQIAAPVGFLLCLVVVLATRHSMSTEAFEAWGWRVPFLLSLLLLALSLFIRMKLSESPVFQAMKTAGTTSKNPIVESLSDRANLGKVMVAMIGVTAGMTVIFYTSQFATLYFLQGTTRIPEEQALLYMAVGAFFAAPAFVTAGWLSDKIGRKTVLLTGYVLSLILVFPIFHLIADGANPALAEATRKSPVTIELPACDYSVFVKPDERVRQGAGLHFKARDRPCEAPGRHAGAGRRRGAGRRLRQGGLYGGAGGGRLSGRRRPGAHRPLEDHPGRRDDRHPVGHHLWPARGDPGRDVSGQDPLHLAIDPVSHRLGLFRRLPAADLAVHRGADGGCLRRAVVHHRGGGAGVRGECDLAEGWPARGYSRLTLRPCRPALAEMRPDSLVSGGIVRRLIGGERAWPGRWRESGSLICRRSSRGRWRR